MIPCRRTLPEALLALAGFGSWDFKFQVSLSCSLVTLTSSVTRRTLVKACCAANQEGIETLWVRETDSVKQFQRVGRVFAFTNVYLYYCHETEGEGCRL